MKKRQDQHLLICSCFSTEHQLVFHLCEGDDFYQPETFLHVHLVRRSLWYRIKYAIKYIFGYKSRFGAWDEFILDSSHADTLKIIAKHLESHDKVQTTSPA